MQGIEDKRSFFKTKRISQGPSLPAQDSRTELAKKQSLPERLAFFIALWVSCVNARGRRSKKPDATLWEHPCFFGEGTPQHLHKEPCDKKGMERRKRLFFGLLAGGRIRTK